MDYQFNISKGSKAAINFSLLFFWISFPLLVYVFLSSLLALVTGQAELNNVTVALLVSAYGLFLSITIPLQIVNQYNRIRVDRDGLHIEVYVFRYTWKFIRWDDILDVKLLHKLDRWGKPQWLIKVRRLTYWHQWISWQHGCGLGSGILINSDLIDREKLLKIIEKNLD